MVRLEKVLERHGSTRSSFQIDDVIIDTVIHRHQKRRRNLPETLGTLTADDVREKS